MALDLTKIAKVDAGYNTAIPAQFSHVSATDAKLTVAAANYFNNYAAELTIGDIIYSFASDGAAGLQVTAVSPNVTVAALY